MANLIYRSTPSLNGAGNSNKGSALTVAEADGNILGLITDIGLKASIAGQTFTGAVSVISGSAGTITLNTSGDISAYRTGGTAGQITLDSAGTKYLLNDGTAYQLAAQRLVVGGNINAPGFTSSWGIGSTTLTGALNAVMGTGASATWLLSSTSGGVFRFGLQGLDAGDTLRIYSGANYLEYTGSSGSLAFSGTSSVTATTLTATGTVSGNAIASTTTVTAGTAVFAATGVTVTSSGLGGTQLTIGDASHSGFVLFNAANGIRQGYIGFSTTSAAQDNGTIPYVAALHNFTGQVTASALVTASSGLTSTAGTTNLGLTNTTTMNASAAIGIGTTSTPESVITQKTTTAAQAGALEIFTFVAATYRSIDLHIQAVDSASAKFHSSRVLIIHDGATANFTEYGAVYTANGIAFSGLTATLTAGNVSITIIPASAVSTTYKVIAIATKV